MYLCIWYSPLISILCSFSMDLSCVTNEGAERVKISEGQTADIQIRGNTPSELLRTSSSCVLGPSLVLRELVYRDSAAVSQIPSTSWLFSGGLSVLSSFQGFHIYLNHCFVLTNMGLLELVIILLLNVWNNVSRQKPMTSMGQMLSYPFFREQPCLQEIMLIY